MSSSASVAEVACPSLSEGARALARLCSLFAPRALAAAHLERLLQDASLAALPLPSAGALAAATAELEAAGLAAPDASGAISIASSAALALMREARAQDALLPLLDAVQRVWMDGSRRPGEDADAARATAYHKDRDTAEVLQRGYLLAGSVQRFKDVPGQVQAHDFALLAEPFAEEALRAVPSALREKACRACLRHVIRHCAPADALIDVCQEIGETPLEYADDIAFIRVLQGRFDAAVAVFEELPAQLRSTVAAVVGKASTLALVAMLRGQDADASPHIEEALNTLRGRRKRLLYPESRTFALSLLALARRDTPASLDLLERVGAAREWNQPERAGLRLAQCAVQVKQKSGLPYQLRLWNGIDALFTGIQCCWLAQAPEQAVLDSIRQLGVRAAENGFAWVAAECGELLRRLPSDANAIADGAGIINGGHAALGTATLTTLAVPFGTWKQSLAVIEELAQTPAADDAEAAPVAEASGRLVWTLHVGGGHVWLETRWQNRNANGAWSRGKQYGAKRLAAESTRMDFLLPQDEAAIAAAATRQEWNKKVSYFGLASLHALAGHPFVVDAEGRTLEVVRREPQLSVDHAADGGVMLRVEPYRAGTDGAYALHRPTPGRCEITHFTAEHRRLFRAIPADGLKLPTGAKARLLNTVPALAPHVRVASSLQNVAAAAARIEADADPWVRLEPLDHGLSVALEVEPIPGAGVCYPPGAGGVVVFASREGENVQAERNFDAERSAVDRLAADCAPLAAKPTAEQPLVLPNADDCLELLERLDDVGARCKWPHGEAMRVVARGANNTLRLNIKSAAGWMQASGELRVDDERVLDLKRLFALLEDNPDSRFLPLGNGEFLALAQSFRRRLDDFAAVAGAGAKNAVRLHPLAALAVEDLIEGAQLDADDGWRTMGERMRTASALEAEVPSTLQADLRPYQAEGFRWLARQAASGVGACLADDMGLGKTIQTLALLLLRAQGGPALVVAPTSVLPNWLAEARRFAPTLAVSTYTGTAAARAALLEGMGAFDLVLATYGVLQNDAAQLAARTWHTVVLDEAQAIKNPNAKRSKAAKALTADFRMITTGTPVQNNLFDLHSLFGFANPGLLGPLRQFRVRFVLPIEREGDQTAQARLKRLVEPFVLRRLKADVLDDLPPRTEITLHVKMSEEEASLYEALRQRALEDLAKAAAGAPMRLFAHLTRLRLACCSPKLVLDADDAPPELPQAGASAKLATFAATLEDLLANRHKVLVFSQFVMHLRLIEDHLRAAGVAYQYLDGATSAKERTARIAAFQAGQGDVFLISLTAGGVGLNLTAADYVIHMDPWWNPAVEDQASDRAHRIGQTRPVTIYRMVTEGTIEEQIVALHHKKRDLAERLLEATDTPAQLDVDELMQLLQAPLGA